MFFIFILRILTNRYLTLSSYSRSDDTNTFVQRGEPIENKINLLSELGDVY